MLRLIVDTNSGTIDSTFFQSALNNAQLNSWHAAQAYLQVRWG